MVDPRNQTEARFAAIVEAFAASRSVTHSKHRSRLFGSSALKVHDKIFAMISSAGSLLSNCPRLGWTNS
jgi:hypothetical protein